MRVALGRNDFKAGTMIQFRTLAAARGGWAGGWSGGQGGWEAVGRRVGRRACDRELLKYRMSMRGVVHDRPEVCPAGN